MIKSLYRFVSRSGISRYLPFRSKLDYFAWRFMDTNNTIVSVRGQQLHLLDDTSYLTRGLVKGEEHEREQIEHCLRDIKAGDIILDVGANIGYYTTILADAVGPEGFVHAFEPNADAVNLLEKNIASNGYENVEVHPVAVTDGCGDVDLYGTQERQGHHSVVGPLLTDDYKRDTVRSISIDSLDLVPDLIKIDVEGAERQVINGMEDTIRSHHPNLLIEVNPSHWPDNDDSMIKNLHSEYESTIAIQETGADSLNSESLDRLLETLRESDGHVDLYFSN